MSIGSKTKSLTELTMLGSLQVPSLENRFRLELMLYC
jgi:hypothetical protein